MMTSRRQKMKSAHIKSIIHQKVSKKEVDQTNKKVFLIHYFYQHDFILVFDSFRPDTSLKGGCEGGRAPQPRKNGFSRFYPKYFKISYFIPSS